MAAALSTQGLNIGYSFHTPLLNNLSLELRPGKLICFMGPNGVGKSTLIRTLAGLQMPLAGSVNKADDATIAVVLTDKILVPHMPVHELISFGRYPYLGWNISMTVEDKAAVDWAVNQVNVRPLLNKNLFELSDGQMQMVMIARALAQQTSIILLDEPTAHLDLNNRVEITNLLRKLAHQEGKAILVATHELDLALQTADEIWLATGAQNVITGVPEDLVLGGAIDEAFQLKGFDLKTGKVQHEVRMQKTIKLVGSGHTWLWTKNALERTGFEVADDGMLEVIVSQDDWIANGQRFVRVEDLLGYLTTFRAV